MGNVIGKKNHRDFVFFLLLETFAMGVSFLVAISRLHQGGPTPGPFAVTYIMIFMVFDGCVLFPVMFLTVAQISQASRNITTNELVNVHRYHYLRDGNGKFHNPFDKGLVQNLRTFLEVIDNEAALQRETVMNMREMEGILKGSDESV
jgi:palmitoyltransferase